MALSPSDLIIVSRGGVNYKAPITQLDERYQVKNENISALSINGGSIAGFRNRIMNGNMIIDQRNFGLAYSVPLNSAIYTSDRWIVHPTGSGCTAQAIENPGLLRTTLLRITGAAGNTWIRATQRIESLNIADLAGKTVTFSFSTSNTLRTSVGWSMSYPATNDIYGGVNTSIASGNITISSTMTRYSVTVTLPAQCTRGLQVILEITNQSSGTWDITDVQVEQGALATPFERRPVQLEELLCRRYFQYTPMNLLGSASGSNHVMEVANPYPGPMRIVPTIGATQVDPSSGTAPQSLNTAGSGMSRRTVDWAAPFIISAGPGLFYIVGYRIPLDSEI